MNYRQIALRIPDNVRSQRLMVDSDPIGNAVPVQTNYAMNLLFEIWFSFVEPNGVKKLNCPGCLKRVLDNFHKMKGELIAIEKDYQLLNAIQ